MHVPVLTILGFGLLGLLPQLVGSVELSPNSAVCIFAIYDILGEINFEGIGYDDFYIGMCQNPLKVTSLYASAKTYCTAYETESGMSYLREWCVEYGLTTMMPESDVAENLTADAIRRMVVLGKDDVPTDENITVPILIAKPWYEIAYGTEDTWNYEYWSHLIFGYITYGFWGLVLVVGMIHRVYRLLYSRRMARFVADVEGDGAAFKKTPDTVVSKAFNWMRTYLVVPSALAPYHRRLLWWCTVPTRAELLVVSAFWGLTIILSCAGYRAFDGNIFWEEIPSQIWRYVADRTGIMSYSNLALLWVFGGRNNIFLWATGWQFSTFNIFHRHIGRIATLQAIIHSIGYTVEYLTDDPSGEDYKTEMAESWFYMGVVATVTLSFLVLLSLSPMRVKFYELFLLLHIALSLVTLVGLFYHTSIFEGEYDVYLWPVVAIWLFDRVLRVGRMLYCNIHVGLNRRSMSLAKSAVSFDEGTNMIRLEMTVKASHLKPQAGQHYFLYQPFKWTGYENHPFTLAYWDEPGSASPVKTASATATESNETRLVFLIRPCDGWTRSLRDRVRTSEQPASPTILLEGPYGHREPLWTFDQVLMIAGGSGISAVLPYILDHLARRPVSKEGSYASPPTRGTRTRNITFMWVDKSEGFIQGLAAVELAAALARDDIHADFFVSSSSTPTRSASASTSDAAAEAKEAGEITKTPGRHDAEERLVSVTYSRPNLQAAIERIARDAGGARSRAAVFVCGPPEMADAARQATYGAMRRFDSSLEYIEESFGW